MDVEKITLNSNIGEGVVIVTEENGKTIIDISVSNSIGVMKVYLMNSENNAKVHIGNLVNGRLKKEVSIDFDDVVISRDGKNVYWSCDENDSACFARILNDTAVIEKEANINTFVIEKENVSTNINTSKPFLKNDNFTWQKITDGSYFSNEPIIRHILNHPKTLEAIYKNRCYYYGVDGDNVAIAIQGENDLFHNPFIHLYDCAVFVDGFWVICANIKENYFYIYE